MPRKSSPAPKKATTDKKLAVKAPIDPPPPPKVDCPFNAAELRDFKGLLIARKRQLAGDVNQMKDEALKKGSDAGDLSSLPMHIADQGTDSFEQEMTLELVENESGEMQQIEEAMARIREGRFGVCEGCNKPMLKSRLKAIPYAKLCVECKRKEDGD